MSMDTTDNPKVEHHVTEEKNFPTPSTYIDAMRQTETKIDSTQETLRTIYGQKMDKCTSLGDGLGPRHSRSYAPDRRKAING